MKRFSFPLDTVLTYKNQALDSLKNEHGKIIAQVIKQEGVLDELIKQYTDLNCEFNEKNHYGITIFEAINYKAYLKSLETKIKRAENELTQLKIQEEAKRTEVVEAKKETTSIDKLKDKKVEQYRKDVQKSEELFIEEFVANCRVTSV